MNKVIIRDYQASDAKALAKIYYNTIHQINSRDYTEDQINAWAPAVSLESDRWNEKWEKLPPLVAVLNNIIVGFAEFEMNGHIDCFYVHHEYQSCGIGKALMNAIMALANRYGCKTIFAEVSITAKPFFEKMGFQIVRENIVTIRGQQLNNYLMEKKQK